MLSVLAKHLALIFQPDPSVSTPQNDIDTSMAVFVQSRLRADFRLINFQICRSVHFWKASLLLFARVPRLHRNSKVTCRVPWRMVWPQ